LTGLFFRSPILGAFILFLALFLGLGGFFLEAAERY